MAPTNASAPKKNLIIHLHTNDLRTVDSHILHLSHHPSSPLSSTTTHFLPIYVFDESYLNLTCLPGYTEHHKSSNALEGPKTRVAKFHRSGRHRTRFLVEAVMDLKERYKKLGGDMWILAGRTDKVVKGLVDRILEEGKDRHIEGLWIQNEVATEEVHLIRSLRRSLGSLPTPIPVNVLHTRTMTYPDDLPMQVEDMPNVFTSFRKQIEGLGEKMIRDPFPTINKLKPCPPLPSSLDPSIYVVPKELCTAEAIMPYMLAPLLASPTIGDSIKPIPIPSSPSEWESYAKSLPGIEPRSAFPFHGGETSGLARLDDYLGTMTGGKNGKGSGGEKGMSYKETRNGLLGEEFSSKFSAWLSFGCFSAKYAGWRVRYLQNRLREEGKLDKATEQNSYWLIFEIEWLDFFFYTCERFSHLYTFAASKLPKVKRARAETQAGEAGTSSTFFNLHGLEEVLRPEESKKKPKWKHVDLSKKDDAGRRFLDGRTGVPFVDASMRELAASGYTGNRMRQNVASFLAVDLYVDWRIGAEWYESMLIDHSVYSNTGNWLYQAGVGNDPRAFRQFSAIKQHNDYDPQDEYVKTWLPELGQLDHDMLPTPWRLPENKKRELGLGTSESAYPATPLVEQNSWKKHYRSGHRGGPGGHSGNQGGHGADHGGNGKKGGHGGPGTKREHGQRQPRQKPQGGQQQQ